MRAFRDLTHVALAEAMPMTERQYAAAGVDLEGAEAAKARIARAGARARGPRSRAGQVGAFGGMVRDPGRHAAGRCW